MNEAEFMFPRARIPYGTWGSSFFPAWQMSALAEVNIAQFAGEAMSRILAKRKVPCQQLKESLSLAEHDSTRRSTYHHTQF